MVRWGGTGGGWDELVQRALGYEARGRVRTVMMGDQGRYQQRWRGSKAKTDLS